MLHECIKLKLTWENNSEWVESHTLLVGTVHRERISGQHHKLQKKTEGLRIGEIGFSKQKLGSKTMISLVNNQDAQEKKGLAEDKPLQSHNHQWSTEAIVFIVCFG